MTIYNGYDLNTVRTGQGSWSSFTSNKRPLVVLRDVNSQPYRMYEVTKLPTGAGGDIEMSLVHGFTDTKLRNVCSVGLYNRIINLVRRLFDPYNQSDKELVSRALKNESVLHIRSTAILELKDKLLNDLTWTQRLLL